MNGDGIVRDMTGRASANTTSALIRPSGAKAVKSDQTMVPGPFYDHVQWRSWTITARCRSSLFLLTRLHNGNRNNCSGGSVPARWRGLGILSLAQLSPQPQNQRMPALSERIYSNHWGRWVLKLPCDPQIGYPRSRLHLLPRFDSLFDRSADRFDVSSDSRAEVRFGGSIAS
jgi:hypothetical protein